MLSLVYVDWISTILWKKRMKYHMDTMDIQIIYIYIIMYN